VVLKAAWRIQ
jgi:hypothetical protein